MTYDPVIEAGNALIGLLLMSAAATAIGFSCLVVYFWLARLKWW